MPHHHHRHGHGHGPTRYDAVFGVAVGLNALYIAVEVAFGLLVSSLALLADAGHNLSDVLGLLLAWGAHYLVRLPPTARRTYGWRSTSIVAALLNALVLLVATGGIAWEAIQRLQEPQEVAASTMMWVAGAGVVVNSTTALLFLRGRAHDLNIRGAFLHMAADAGVSAGVVLAGLGIRLTGWTWLDPAASLVVAGVILLGTLSLFRQSFNLLLQAVPERIDPLEVKEFLLELPGVGDVHDLHIWAMSTTETALTAHIVRPDAPADDAFLHDVSRDLHDRFGIEHVTLQVERSTDNSCRQAPPDAL